MLLGLLLLITFGTLFYFLNISELYAISKFLIFGLSITSSKPIIFFDILAVLVIASD